MPAFLPDDKHELRLIVETVGNPGQVNGAEGIGNRGHEFRKPKLFLGQIHPRFRRVIRVVLNYYHRAAA